MVKTLVLPCLVSAGAIASWTSGVSQELHEDIPPNAHYRAGEQSWTCNEGFRQVGQLCVLDTYGAAEPSTFEYSNGQWRCRPGYSLDKGFCVPPAPPEHASFVGDGDRWECNWGYQRVGSRCKEINPPAHGYLDPSGHDWVCYPGFERVSDSCVAGNTVAPAAPEESKSGEAPKTGSDAAPQP